MTTGAAPLTDDRPKRLSDERFDLDAGLQSYVPWLDTAKARERFERDPWIRKVWPPELWPASVGYFPVQAEINRSLIPTTPRSLEVTLPMVHAALTGSPLKTLPLWMLTSNALRQEAARSALARGGADARVFYELALGELVDRNYLRAVELFSQSSAAGGTGPILLTLSQYASFMAHDATGQRELLRELEERGPATGLEPWVLPFLKQSARGGE